MTEAVATREVNADTLEKVLLGGNLSVLTPAERLTYYQAVCTSVGLNPLTRPFEYLSLNGKLVLYARREATEQLRKIHGVSIGKLDKTFKDDLYIVEAPATDRSGRTDSSTGAVNLKGLSGESLANALMKAETKAKRRVTLSICGLGMLDETEVDSIPGARRVPMPEIPPDEDDDPFGGAFGTDDVPAVDVRADSGDEAYDLGELAARQEAQEARPLSNASAPVQGEIGLPAPSQAPKPATPARPRVSEENRRFCTEMKKQKLRVGGPAYYQVLGGAGFSHSWEVLNRQNQLAIFNALKALPEVGP